MAQNSRIPRAINPFIDYIDNADDHQKAIDPLSGQPRYVNWGWTAAESSQWSNYRVQADGYYASYSNKSLRNQDVTNNLHQVINNVVFFDQSHHLLDKISITPPTPAILSDYETFNVKKGTPLAGRLHGPPLILPGIHVPVLSMKKTAHLVQQIHVTNPDKPKSTAKPKGIKEIQVYRATGASNAASPADAAYVYAGDVKRGSYISNYVTTDVGNIAYYKVRYKSTNGDLGAFSPVVSAVIG